MPSAATQTVRESRGSTSTRPMRSVPPRPDHCQVAPASSDRKTPMPPYDEREELGSTGIGSGVAIPHCKVERLEEVIVAIGILDEAIEFGASDGLPVRLLFLVLSPESSPAAHLKSLAAISRWVQADSHVERILEEPSRDFILELLSEVAPEGTGVA